MLAIATAVGSLGLAAGGTAGALQATEMTGSSVSAGLPLGGLVAGSALGALLISRATGRAGRTTGLALGYGLGAAGAAVAVGAAVFGSFGLLLAGSVAMGAANAAVFLARYAAADATGAAGRGRALGVVLFGAAVGAVAGPNLLAPSGQLASGMGLPHLTGLYLVAAPAFAVAGTILAVLGPHARDDWMLRPLSGSTRPAFRTLPRTLTVPGATSSRAEPERSHGSLRSMRAAVLVLALTNLVMVAIMAIAPVHLAAHGHDLDVVGFIVSIHVFCMLAPAPLAGWLVDRAGTPTVEGVAAALLVAAGVAAALADAHDTVVFTVVLALLGLGWCAGIVAGSTMLATSLPAPERPRAEGIGEVAMGLAAGASAPIAGVVVALGGFPTLAFACAAVAVLAVVPTAANTRGRRRPPRNARRRVVSLRPPLPPRRLDGATQNPTEEEVAT